MDDEALVDSLAKDWRQASLSEQDAGLCAYAEKLTLCPGEVSQNEVQALRVLGLNDRAIHDAAQVISYFNYISRVAEGLGVDLEPEMVAEQA